MLSAEERQRTETPLQHQGSRLVGRGEDTWGSRSTMGGGGKHGVMIKSSRRSMSPGDASLAYAGSKFYRPLSDGGHTKEGQD